MAAQLAGAHLFLSTSSRRRLAEVEAENRKCNLRFEDQDQTR